MFPQELLSKKYLDFHTHSERRSDDDQVIEIVSIHLSKPKAASYYTVGSHPWWTHNSLNEKDQELLFNQLVKDQCLALGEIGLDKLKGIDMSKQMNIVRSQLSVLGDINKPVIIHCVRAFDQLAKIKKEFPQIKKWCIHGFGRHGILANQLVDQGYYISLMPRLPKAKYEDVLSNIPLDRLFLETDSMPDVSIEDVYQDVAKTLRCSLDSLQDQMKSNANTFFNFASLH